MENLIQKLKKYETFLTQEIETIDGTIKSISGKPYFEGRNHIISSLGSVSQAYDSARSKLYRLFPELSENKMKESRGR